jgi:hypothetical protein
VVENHGLLRAVIDCLGFTDGPLRGVQVHMSPMGEPNAAQVVVSHLVKRGTAVVRLSSDEWVVQLPLPAQVVVAGIRGLVEGLAVHEVRENTRYGEATIHDWLTVTVQK